MIGRPSLCFFDAFGIIFTVGGCPHRPRQERGYTELLDDDNDEVTRAVHALDTSELDIRGSGRARDPRCRLFRVHAGDDLGDAVDDLILVDDAQVAVRNQGERATAAALVRLEHDGAGLGGGDVGISCLLYTSDAADE